MLQIRIHPKMSKSLAFERRKKNLSTKYRNIGNLWSEKYTNLEFVATFWIEYLPHQFLLFASCQTARIELSVHLCQIMPFQVIHIMLVRSLEKMVRFVLSPLFFIRFNVIKLNALKHNSIKPSAISMRFCSRFMSFVPLPLTNLPNNNS